MRRRGSCGIVVASLIGLLVGATPVRAEGQSRERPLSPLFFAFLWDAELPPGGLDRLAPDVRSEVSRRLSLRGSYQPLFVPPTPSDPIARSRSLKQTRFESFLVAILGDTSIQAEATAIARQARFAYEWEGMTGAAMAEAKSAEAYLRRHPESAAGPALQIFILHRLRCEFEAATWNEDFEEQAEAREAYRKTWALLQKSVDPVIRAVAHEIDTDPHVYIAVNQHPRTGRKP